jgi:oligoribonuclease
MRYVSIDIETTGLDPDYCQILQFAAVIENTQLQTPLNQLPSFVRWIDHPDLQFEKQAMRMHLNSDLVQEWLQSNPIPVDQFMLEYRDWLGQYGLSKPVYAGKNIGGFDIQFLRRLPGWPKHCHRYLDPAAYYIEPGDEAPPDLKTCLQRCGIEKEVTHDAYQDAIDVITALRHKAPFYENRSAGILRSL